MADQNSGHSLECGGSIRRHYCNHNLHTQCWCGLPTADELGQEISSICLFLPQNSVRIALHGHSCDLADPSRLIIFIILNVNYLSDFQSSRNPSVTLTKPILFRESQVIFSLLSASIPTLNQYLRKFNTQQATQFGYNPGAYAGGSDGRSYNMKSFTKKSKHDNEKTWTGSSNGGKADEILGKSTGNNFDPQSQTNYNATVEGHPNGAHDGISNVSQEDGSIGRHNSEDYIIRKDVRYEVRHEE